MLTLKKIVTDIKYTIVLASLMLICACTGYVEYVPVVLIVERGDHILKEEPSLINPEHIQAMKEILEKYDESYKMKDGKLYIKQSLQNDKDLLQNYTSKAEALLKEQKAME